MLCVTVRCICELNGKYSRSMSGDTARIAQARVRPFPARSYHDADGGAVRQARSPGTRSAIHAAATQARAWPIGVGIRAHMMADSAIFRADRRKWLTA